MTASDDTRRIALLETAVPQLRDRVQDLSKSAFYRSDADPIYRRLVDLEKEMAAMKTTMESVKDTERTLRALDREVAALKGRLIGAAIVITVAIPAATALITKFLGG